MHNKAKSGQCFVVTIAKMAAVFQGSLQRPDPNSPTGIINIQYPMNQTIYMKGYAVNKNDVLTER